MTCKKSQKVQYCQWGEYQWVLCSNTYGRARGPCLHCSFIPVVTAGWQSPAGAVLSPMAGEAWWREALSPQLPTFRFRHMITSFLAARDAHYSPFRPLLSTFNKSKTLQIQGISWYCWSRKMISLSGKAVCGSLGSCILDLRSSRVDWEIQSHFGQAPSLLLPTQEMDIKPVREQPRVMCSPKWAIAFVDVLNPWRKLLAQLGMFQLTAGSLPFQPVSQQQSLGPGKYALS